MSASSPRGGGPRTPARPMSAPSRRTGPPRGGQARKINLFEGLGTYEPLPMATPSPPTRNRPSSAPPERPAPRSQGACWEGREQPAGATWRAEDGLERALTLGKLRMTLSLPALSIVRGKIEAILKADADLARWIPSSLGSPRFPLFVLGFLPLPLSEGACLHNILSPHSFFLGKGAREGGASTRLCSRRARLPLNTRNPSP